MSKAPDPNKRYRLRWSHDDRFSDNERDSLVSVLTQESPGLSGYTFSLENNPDKEYSISYGWAFFEDTPDAELAWKEIQANFAEIKRLEQVNSYLFSKYSLKGK